MRKLFSNRRAATAIEYSLIAGLIAVVIILSMSFFSDQASTMYSTIGSALDSNH